MKRLLTLAVAFLFCLAMSSALAAPGTLYQQEEGPNDKDPVEVDAAGHGPLGTNFDNCTNWKYQYGAYSWWGVYAGDSGWLIQGDSGDGVLAIEADVEMYCEEWVTNHKIYFHIGNIYVAKANPATDLTALVQGGFTSNNGQYIGISFAGTAKVETDFEKDGSGNLTGKVINGMHSAHDTWRAQNNDMDIKFTMATGGGAYVPPGSWGVGAHGTVGPALWWLVNGGVPGTYLLFWKVELLPVDSQPDGDYYLDPTIVAAPIL